MLKIKGNPAHYFFWKYKNPNGQRSILSFIQLVTYCGLNFFFELSSSDSNYHRMCVCVCMMY